MFNKKEENRDKILIDRKTYEELLITKGKYEAKKDILQIIMDAILEAVGKGRLTPNQARIITGLKPFINDTSNKKRK